MKFLSFLLNYNSPSSLPPTPQPASSAAQASFPHLGDFFFPQIAYTPYFPHIINSPDCRLLLFFFSQIYTNSLIVWKY